MTSRVAWVLNAVTSLITPGCMCVLRLTEEANVGVAKSVVEKRVFDTIEV